MSDVTVVQSTPVVSVTEEAANVVVDAPGSAITVTLTAPVVSVPAVAQNVTVDGNLGPQGEPGPPGPPGPAGSGAPSSFTQPTPVSSFTVVHNLGRVPFVQVRDLLDAVVAIAVHHLDNNSLQVSCDAPMTWAGTVLCF